MSGKPDQPGTTDLGLCSWCDRPKALRPGLPGSLPPFQTFCSETCFLLFRRATFKRDRANKTSTIVAADETLTLPTSVTEDKTQPVSPPVVVKVEKPSSSTLTASTSIPTPVPASPILCPPSHPFYHLNHAVFSPPPVVNPNVNIVTKTVPIFVPLPIPIPLPIFKNAPELLSILARHGYRPRNGGRHRQHRHRHHISRRELPLPQPVSPLAPSPPQDVALDLRLQPSPPSSPPQPPSLSVDQTTTSSLYSARRRRILDVSPVAPLPDKIGGYVDRYRAASAIRLRRLRKAKEFRVLTAGKSRGGKTARS